MPMTLWDAWKIPGRLSTEASPDVPQGARIVRGAAGAAMHERKPVVTAAPKKNAPPPRSKNPAAVALGRIGGPLGGKARALALTKQQRHDISLKAALARWKKEA